MAEKIIVLTNDYPNRDDILGKMWKGLTNEEIFKKIHPTQRFYDEDYISEYPEHFMMGGRGTDGGMTIHLIIPLQPGTLLRKPAARNG